MSESIRVIRREPEVFDARQPRLKLGETVWNILWTHDHNNIMSDADFHATFTTPERAADEAWNEKIRQLKLDAVCSEIPESVTGEDIRLDIADWLDKRIRPIAERDADGQ